MSERIDAVRNEICTTKQAWEEARRENPGRPVDELSVYLERFACDLASDIDALAAERDEARARLDAIVAMFVPKPDNDGNEPLYCDTCAWTGHNPELCGDTPMDEWLACPVCGNDCEEITEWSRYRLGQIYARAVAIREGREEQ